MIAAVRTAQRWHMMANIIALHDAEEKGGYNNDIYVCFLEKDGTWTEPKSLGKKINLPDYDEMTPYLAADGVTLYFSSNRPGGLGDNDIWMTKRLDSTWQKWSEPVNLGEPDQYCRLGCFFYTGCRWRICLSYQQRGYLW